MPYLFDHPKNPLLWIRLNPGLEIGPSFGKWTKSICQQLSFELELCSKIEKSLKSPLIFGQILFLTQVLTHNNQ